MQCPNCETENRDGAKFCDACGFPLSGAIARAGGASSPVASGDALAAGEADVSAQGETPRPEPGADLDSGVQEETERDTETGDCSFGGEEDEAAKAADDASPQEPESEPEPESEEGAGAEQAAEPAEDATAGSGWLDDRAFVPSDELDYYDRLAEQGSIDHEVAGSPSGGGSAWPSGFTMKMPKIEDGEAEASRDFMASSAKKRQREWKRPAVIAACIVAAIAIVVGIVVVAGGAMSGKQIPDVVEMTEADARTTLENAGFTVKSLQVPSDETDGLVLLMDPVAGTRAEEGSEVVIQVATSRIIPDVEGKSYDEAASALESAGYKNVRVEKQKTDEEENVVVSVSPEAGTRVKSTVEVVLTVTEGYYVPDISGLDIDSARAAIEEAGLTPDAVYVDTTDYVEGTLIGTYPEAGAKVSGGDVVVINIARARGAELVALTQGLLAPGSMVTVGGYNFDIESLDAVEYLGDDTVAFTFTGRPRVVLFGETLYTSSTQVVSGTVVWSESNEVLSIG